MFNSLVLFLGLGLPELLIILFIVLLIFGGPRLPKLGKAIGDTIKQIKGHAEEAEEKSKEEIAAEKKKKKKDKKKKNKSSDED